MYEVHIEVTFKPSGFLLGSVMNSMSIWEGNFSALCKTRNMDSYWNDWSIEQTEQQQMWPHIKAGMGNSTHLTD